MMKKRAEPSGAPLWVLTYGDMMSLLLCFFILLCSFANFEKEHGEAQIMVAMQSIQQALGIRTTPRPQVQDTVDFNAIMQTINEALKSIEKGPQGNTPEPGVKGRHYRLRKIRDGLEIILGSPVLFKPFSAELTEEGKTALASICENVKGHRNKIDIRGHAADEPRPGDWTDRDAMQLSFNRAERVSAELIRGGIDPRALRLVAVGANEPLARPNDDSADKKLNNRVEIIIRESLLDDYKPPAKSEPASLPTP